MEQHYKLDKVRDLAGGDEDFVAAIAATFLEEVPPDAELLEQAVADLNYKQAYQSAHKMKPTIELFDLGVFDDLIVVQDWGKFEKVGEDCSSELARVLAAVKQATAEIKSDFNL